MTDVQITHRNAMEKTDLAILERLQGNHDAAQSLFREAYQLEKEAALKVAQGESNEPSRSVLLRSAASLAMDCNLLADAEKLICLALSGSPPDFATQELRDLLEQVHFQRHLDLRGITLNEDEMQMSLAGEGVGFGMAPTELFLHRVQKTESLLYRTAERKQNRSYRDRGRLDKKTQDNFSLYMSVPRAASFAVTFRIGKSEQLALPGMSFGAQVIDEMLNCIELYTSGNKEELKKRIPDEAYYNNFVGLAESIAPDGKEINLVGFTTKLNGQEKRVAIKPAEGKTIVQPKASTVIDVPDENVQEDTDIIGILKFADSRKEGVNKIQIIDETQTRHTITVPPGMMSDIVKPLWDTKVQASALKKGRSLHLVSVKPYNE